jgi:hypothetical protein
MRKHLIFRDRRVGAFAFGQRIYEQKAQIFTRRRKPLYIKDDIKDPYSTFLAAILDPQRRSDIAPQR